jgi:hypothetical protein
MASNLTEPIKRRPRSELHDRRLRPGALAAVYAGISLILSSCNNDKVEVYHIPKESVDVAMQSAAGSLAAPSPTDNPVQWTKPGGWNAQPLSEMRLGSFKVDGAGGSSADISVTAFPGEAGGLGSNLNRWRGQLQLPSLSDEGLSSVIQRTEVENVPAYLVDFQTENNNPKPSRILGAVFQTADRTWFVKMTGPPDLLESQRQKFLDFVRSFHFSSPAAPEQRAPPGTTKPKSTNDA